VGAYARRRQQRGAEWGCGNFLRHIMNRNYVSSVEADMGIKGQIMCTT